MAGEDLFNGAALTGIEFGIAKTVTGDPVNLLRQGFYFAQGSSVLGVVIHG